MKIQCTKKLLEELGVNLEEVVSESSLLFSWHSTIVKVDRRKTVLLVNDLTRICLVLYGLTAKEFKKFDLLVLDAIRQIMTIENVKEDIIERYINECGILQYTVTGGKSIVAKMNGISRDMQFHFFEDLDQGNIIQKEISYQLNHSLVRGYDQKYVQPFEELKLQLDRYYDCDVHSSEALEEASDSDVCQNCMKKKVRNIMTGTQKERLQLCPDCFNQIMAEQMNLELMPFEQKNITFTNKKGKHFTFHINRFVIPMLISFDAEEIRTDGHPGRKINHMSHLPCDENKLWDAFCSKISRSIENDYIHQEIEFYGEPVNRLINDEVAGYLEWSDAYNGSIHDVVIDGKRYSWEELGRMLNEYEGYQFKLQILDKSDDINKKW